MFTYKIVFLGNEGVGKTSIAQRINDNKFSSHVEATIGCDFFAKKYGDYKLMFWDTAGQEVFKSFTPQFARGAHVGVIFHDLSKEYCERTTQDYINMLPLDTIVILAFTKADLVDKSDSLPQVHFDFISKGYINKNRISAKLGENIESLEEMILEKIKEHIPGKKEALGKIDIKDDDGDDRFCCKIN